MTKLDIKKAAIIRRNKASIELQRSSIDERQQQFVEEFVLSEAFSGVFEFLYPEEILSSSVVCHRWNQFTQNDYLWKLKLLEKLNTEHKLKDDDENDIYWSEMDFQTEREEEHKTWRELFRESFPENFQREKKHYRTLNRNYSTVVFILVLLFLVLVGLKLDNFGIDYSW